MLRQATDRPTMDRKIMDESTAKRAELERFTRVLCHEVRTPLNAATAALGLIEAKYAAIPDPVDNIDELKALVCETARTGNPEKLMSLLRQMYEGPGAHGGPLAIRPLITQALAGLKLTNAICEVRKRARVTRARDARVRYAYS